MSKDHDVLRSDFPLNSSVPECSLGPTKLFQGKQKSNSEDFLVSHAVLTFIHHFRRGMSKAINISSRFPRYFAALALLL